jgi:iron complex outermembrane receptor protein
MYSGTSELVSGAVANGTIGGQNIMAGWTGRLSDNSSLKVQFYWDNARRNLTSGIRAAVDTFDFSAQYDFSAGPDHKFVVGGGYRITDDAFARGPGTSFLDPGERDLHLGNLFIQDTVGITSTLSWTIGLKLEHNSYTGLEFMPDTRLAWQVSDTSLLWASASRAVRTPSRFDTDLFSAGVFAGGPDFTSEDLLAFEIGYRGRVLSDLTISVSTYFNIYEDLRTVEASSAVVFPLVVRNGMRGNVYGMEAWGTYALADWWRVKAGVNAMRKELHIVPGSRDIFGVDFAGNDPSYQFQLQSDMDLPGGVTLNLGMRNIDSLASPAVPAYVEGFATINWRIAPWVQLSLAGMNIFNDRHQEFIKFLNTIDGVVKATEPPDARQPLQ